MLSTATPQDEAAVAKVAELRESLKKIMEEKAALLSVEALQVEIEMHQRHVSDLKALQELLKLEQSLKELSDKYPTSGAGQRAKQMLDLLNQKRSNRNFDSFAPDHNDIPIKAKGT